MYLRALDRVIEGPSEPPQPMEKIELDRDKAKAWFESMGVKVVEKTETA